MSYILYKSALRLLTELLLQSNMQAWDKIYYSEYLVPGDIIYWPTVSVVMHWFQLGVWDTVQSPRMCPWNWKNVLIVKVLPHFFFLSERNHFILAVSFLSGSTCCQIQEFHVVIPCFFQNLLPFFFCYKMQLQRGLAKHDRSLYFGNSC